MKKQSSIFACGLLIFLLSADSSAESRVIKHEKLLGDIAESNCSSENIEGKDYLVDVRANGDVEVKWLGKKGGKIEGNFIYTKKQWEGRQRVLSEHQASENKDYRKCKITELKYLRETLKINDSFNYISLEDKGGECVNGKITNKININNYDFEKDAAGSPEYWKFGIEHGWGYEPRSQFLGQGVGVFNIDHHKVITFGTENTGQNVGFLNKGETLIRQTLNHGLKENALYILSALVGQRIDIPLGSYSLELYAGDQLLAKTSSPRPIRGEFVLSQVKYDTTKKTQSIGRPLQIVVMNTGSKKISSQLVVDNFYITESVDCS